MFEFIGMFIDLLYLLDLEHFFSVELLDTWIRDTDNSMTYLCNFNLENGIEHVQIIYKMIRCTTQ